jgi:K+-transporting ATPase A subunit
MNAYDWLQIVFYFIVLLGLARPLGSYMARVYQGQRTILHPLLASVERLIYRAGGIRSEAEMNWKQYAWSVLLFNFIGIFVVYALQRLQGWLPLNPMGFGAVSPDSSFNTAVSFGTNTNWQGYVPETTMSYLTQMMGLAVQNFPRLPARSIASSHNLRKGEIGCRRPAAEGRAGQAGDRDSYCQGTSGAPGSGGFADRDQTAGDQRRRFF